MQDVADPGGLVKSQASSPPTAASGSSSTRRRARAPSPLGSSRRCSARACITSRSPLEICWQPCAPEGERIALLPIPENYYDDLEAKTDLRPSECHLQAHGILYDREGDAEYLQAYTKAFEHRFSSRSSNARHGYSGYGAANAPIRLASQARLTPE